LKGEALNRVRTTRVVSARELSRRMSSLLDEVESESAALVVIRYGRPAAMLVPFREAAERPQLPRITDIVSPPSMEFPDEDDEQLELGDDQRIVMLGLAHCAYLHWTPSQADLSASRLAVALGLLENKRLIERKLGGSWHLTPRGERLARKLDSDV
jgi:antitoxin (DNA-binding transcriptional repressor) of toxin-antitoxin stability system